MVRYGIIFLFSCSQALPGNTLHEALPHVKIVEAEPLNTVFLATGKEQENNIYSCRNTPENLE